MDEDEKAELCRLLARKIALNQQSSETLAKLLKALKGREGEANVTRLTLLVTRRNRLVAEMNETLDQMIAALQWSIMDTADRTAI